MSEKVALELLIQASESAKTVGELRKSIKDLKDEALAVGSESPEAFNALTKAASEAGERLKHVNENIAAVNPENLGKSFAKLGASIGGAFEVGIGASALFGAESANLEKQLVKIQAVMALTQGLSEVSEIGKSFKLAATSVKAFSIEVLGAEAVQKVAAVATRIWNAVISANPILKFVALLAAATAGIYALSKAFAEEKETAEEANAAIDAHTKALEEDLAAADNRRDFNEKLLSAEGASDEELFKQKKEHLLDYQKDRIRAGEELFEDIKKLNKKINESESEEDIEKYKEQLKKLEEQDKKVYDETNKARQDLVILNASYDTKIREEDAKAAEEAEKKRREAAEAAAKKSREEKEATRKFFADIAAEEADEIAKSEQEKANDFIVKDKEAFDFRFLTKQEQFDLEREQEEERAANELASAQRIADAKMSIQQSSFEGLQALGNIFINDQKKLEKFNKAAALVQIGIDTARAISSLVAQSQANPTNAATGGIAGVAQFAVGIAQILTNVAKAKALLGASGSSDGVGGSTGARGGSAPQRNDDVARIAEANTGRTNLDAPTVKAVVVETDITSTQKRVNSIEEKASI